MTDGVSRGTRGKEFLEQAECERSGPGTFEKPCELDAAGVWREGLAMAGGPWPGGLSALLPGAWTHPGARGVRMQSGGVTVWGMSSRRPGGRTGGR